MRLDRLESNSASALLIAALTLAGVLTLEPAAWSQGCMPATPQPLPPQFNFEPVEDGDVVDFGEAENVPRTARELQLLAPHDWSFAVSFRYFKSGDKFVGSTEDPAGKNGAVGKYPSLNLSGTYAFNSRWSLSVSLPLVNPRDTFPHADGQPHTTGPGLSIGDLRAVGSYWLFDPSRPRSGNMVFGFGIKAPTGKYDVTDSWFTPEGPIELPADIAVQPGDGGWGVILAAQGFQAFGRGAYFYGDGFYLINPRETNGTVTATVLAQTGLPIPLSVHDYYQARAGFGYMAWPRHGISLRLGMRIDGIPTEDLIGGSNGFRRPGYVLAVDPGISVMSGDHTFSVFVPVAVARSQKQSVPEQDLGVRFGGSMAGEALIIAYSRRLGKSGASRP
jgi:hypothetical protein